MDTISLIKVGPTAADEAVSFVINGRDLIDTIFDYDGVALGLPLRVVAQERKFTVFTERQSATPERLVVLASEYGWSGVTAVTAMVTLAEGAVTWSELAPAWRRRQTRIPRLGPFTFDRRQYEDVMVSGRVQSDEWRALYESLSGHSADKMRCSEPGHRAPVAIVASRGPGRLAR